MESTMSTQLIISNYTFNWEIRPFDSLCPKEFKEFGRIASECFTAGEDVDKKSQWFVKLGGKSENISCYLAFHSFEGENNGAKSIRCSFNISLGSREDKKVYRSCPEHKFEIGCDYGFKNVISIAELYEKEETLLRNNTLIVSIQMQIYGEHFTTSTVLPLYANRNVDTLKILSADFSQMFNNKKYSDVKIVCGTETFYAHKVILSASSKVFNAMFESKMRESASNEVSLTDIDADTFYTILLYIYTGKVEVNHTSAYTELIYGAEKYDLSKLKQCCFDQLLQNVTDETIGALAVAAENFNADMEIKKSVKEYCLRNMITFVKNPAFKKLVTTHPDAFF